MFIPLPPWPCPLLRSLGLLHDRPSLVCIAMERVASLRFFQSELEALVLTPHLVWFNKYECASTH